MKRVIAILILILTGCGILFYPRVSNWLSEKNQSLALQTFDETVKQLDETKIVKEWEKARAYNDSLQGIVLRDPFVEGSGMALQDNYTEVLNVDGLMGYIEIPRIEVRLAIYHGTAEKTLEKGVGHLEGTSLPIGGDGCHAVLTGHTGLSTAKFFTDLVRLEEGDRFYLHVLDQVLAYKVDQIKIVEPENTKDLKRAGGKDLITLVTCTPYGVNSHRLLVRGERIPYAAVYNENEVERGREKSEEVRQENLVITIIVFLVSVIIIIPAFIIYKRRKKRED